MKEFTYGELKHGLLCCTVYKDCLRCPCKNENEEQQDSAEKSICMRQLMSAAFNCINIMEKDLMEFHVEHQCGGYDPGKDTNINN